MRMDTGAARPYICKVHSTCSHDRQAGRQAGGWWVDLGRPRHPGTRETVAAQIDPPRAEKRASGSAKGARDLMELRLTFFCLWWGGVQLKPDPDLGALTAGWDPFRGPSIRRRERPLSSPGEAPAAEHSVPNRAGLPILLAL